jgi:hypothetical protein
MAVIEIKSDLTKKEAKKFAKRTKILKEIHRPQPLSGFYHGFYPLDRIASYLVAYNGPKKMETVVNWLNEFNYDIDINRRQRIDMIIVLGKGVVCRLASLPRPLQPDQSLKLGHKWLFVTQEMNNLYALFSHMLLWVGNVSVPSNLSSYLDRIHTEAWKSS